jgi:hypothetical protein
VAVTPAQLNAQVEEVFTGHALVKASGVSATSRPASTTENDRAVRLELLGAVHRRV